MSYIQTNQKIDKSVFLRWHYPVQVMGLSQSIKIPTPKSTVKIIRSFYTTVNSFLQLIIITKIKFTIFRIYKATCRSSR